MKSVYIVFSSVILLLILSGCKVIEIRGQYVDDDALNRLDDKKMNKAEVVDLIGTPTIIPDYSSNVWCYMQRSLSRRAWFEPKIVEQRIVKVVFNNKNLVDEVVLLQNSQDEAIKVSSLYTKTYGTELNAMQKFIKNIGRFNKGKSGTTGRKKK